MRRRVTLLLHPPGGPHMRGIAFCSTLEARLPGNIRMPVRTGGETREAKTGCGRIALLRFPDPPPPDGGAGVGTYHPGSGEGVPWGAMSELIRKPRTRVDRRLVEAAIMRLVRHPGTTTLGTIMRLVDEYAASQHTDLVHRHAEKVVAEALVEAHRAMEAGKKIFLCESFQSHEKFFSEKIFFIEGSEDRPMIKVGGATSPGTNRVRTIPGTKGGTNRTRTVTRATDTSGPTTRVTDNRDTDTPATDTRVTDTPVTDTRDSATDAGGMVTLATGAGDTTDTVDSALTNDAQPDRAPVSDAPEDDTSSVRVPERPSAGPGDGAEGKPCTQCAGWFPLSGYGLNRSRPDGRASACRGCEQARSTARRNARKKGQNGA